MKSVFLTYILFGIVAWAQASENAYEIIHAQHFRHKVANETTVMEITLTDRKGFREERILKRFEKESDKDITYTLTMFNAPSDIKGTALLTRENAGKPNDQWLYFPSQKRTHRIAQSRRNGYFMGTDFTYEDLDPDCIENYVYSMVRSEQLNGHDCYVIKAVPATEKLRKASGYGSRLLWVRKDILYTTKIEFFDREDNLIKVQTNSDLRNISGDVWRAWRSFVDNKKKLHKTELVVLSHDIQTILKDSTFSERHILTGRYMQ